MYIVAIIVLNMYSKRKIAQILVNLSYYNMILKTKRRTEGTALSSSLELIFFFASYCAAAHGA